MNVKTTTTLLHKWLLSNGFTFNGSSKTTNSSYYCKKGIQLRISDHLTETYYDLLILVPHKKGNKYGICFKRQFVTLNNLAEVKTFISNIFVLSEISDDYQIHLKQKEIMKLSQKVVTPEAKEELTALKTQLFEAQAKIEELQLKIGRQKQAYTSLQRNYDKLVVVKE